MPYVLIVASFLFKSIMQNLQYISIWIKIPVLFQKTRTNDFFKRLKTMDWCLFSSEDASTELIQVLIMT